ncbi:protein SLOW GREEN 1, chloroplastic-like [Wolffia australiana]
METSLHGRQAMVPRVGNSPLRRFRPPVVSIFFSRPVFCSSSSPPSLLQLQSMAGIPIPQRTSFPLRSSKQESTIKAPGEAILSFLKPVYVLLAVGATFLFGLRSPLPALALAAESETLDSSPSEDSETLRDDVKERILEEHLDLHPEDVKSLRALMNLKIKAQKLGEAVGIVDRLIALEPAEKDLVLLKAHMQSFGGDTETARQMFEEILDKDPLFVEAYHGLVMAASGPELEGDLSSILSRIQSAMEICKKEKKKEELRDFKLLMAQVRVMEGMYDEALKLYQELVKEEPRDFRPYLCQGIIYTLLKKKDEADKQFQKYRRLVPKGHPYAQYFDESMKSMNIFDGSNTGSAPSYLQRYRGMWPDHSKTLTLLELY